jgi:E3 ubiquitin-protein transferase RMND5
LENEFKQRFRVLDEILSDLGSKKIDKAIKWVNDNIVKLKIYDSDLPFLVHKISFCHMLKMASDAGECQEQMEILSKLAEYSTKNLAQFYTKFRVQIHKLMGSIAFVNNLEDTKYYDLVNNVHWDHLTQSFVRDFCKIQGLSKESGLFMTLKVGTLGIPKFQAFFKLMKGKERLFEDINDFPIEMSLGSDFKFHSIFICPVSKEIATKENPPMLLKCGHCITKQSFNTILSQRNERSGRKSKCPTCPAEIKENEAVELKIF